MFSRRSRRPRYVSRVRVQPNALTMLPALRNARLASVTGLLAAAPPQYGIRWVRVKRVWPAGSVSRSLVNLIGGLCSKQRRLLSPCLLHPLPARSLYTLMHYRYSRS